MGQTKTKNISDLKILVPEKLFSPTDNFGLNYILYLNFLWAEKSFESQKFILPQNFSDPNIFSPPNNF